MIQTFGFERFRAAIASLPDKPRYAKSDLLCDRFLLFSEGGLDVYYAPFHRANPGARVALVGLTPGWTQMELAFRAARQGLAEGLDDEALFHRIDTTGSFGGALRVNLVEMRDGIGLDGFLRAPSCADLFEDSSGLALFDVRGKRADL